MLQDEIRHRPALEGQVTRDQFVQDNAHRVDVGLGADLLARCLLGRRVRRCADERPVQRPQRLAALVGIDLGRLGQTEVQQLDEVGAAVAFDEEDVVGFEIAVREPAGVRRRQRLAHLGQDGQEPLRRQRPLGGHGAGQRLALQDLHHQGVHPLGGDGLVAVLDDAVDAALDDVGDLDDVRVVDAIDRHRLGEQALDRLGPHGVLGGQRLHRRAAADALVLDLEDAPRRPLAQQAQQPVRPDLIPRLRLGRQALAGQAIVQIVRIGRDSREGAAHSPKGSIVPAEESRADRRPASWPLLPRRDRARDAGGIGSSWTAMVASAWVPIRRSPGR